MLEVDLPDGDRRGETGLVALLRKLGDLPAELHGVTSLLEDAGAGLLNQPRNDGDIAELLTERDVEFVSWSGWERIDAHEQDLGAGVRPRVKLTRYELLHGAARGEK